MTAVILAVRQVLAATERVRQSADTGRRSLPGYQWQLVLYEAQNVYKCGSLTLDAHIKLQGLILH